MAPPQEMTLPSVAGGSSVAASIRRRTLHACCAILPLAALGGCTDYAFYVKPDSGAGVPLDQIGLNAADLSAEPLEVAVTFKSDDMVQKQASDALYKSIKSSLKSRGIEHLHRSSSPQGDVSEEIAALAKAPPAAATPRLLVLVENHPDLSGNTAVKYFFSGVSLGAWSLNKPTDRYDITLAYRDAHGQAHLYHGHQELIFSTGSTLFGRDREAVAGLRRFDEPDAAFGAAMSNSLTGGPGVVKVGQPDFAPPQAAAAPAAVAKAGDAK
ncbi:MAG: hypothetical protein JOY51_05870 [Nevskia sp.]|nr:hypothetical protein [Nevskia sp.]